MGMYSTYSNKLRDHCDGEFLWVRWLVGGSTAPPDDGTIASYISTLQKTLLAPRNDEILGRKSPFDASGCLHNVCTVHAEYVPYTVVLLHLRHRNPLCEKDCRSGEMQTSPAKMAPFLAPMRLA